MTRYSALTDYTHQQAMVKTAALFENVLRRLNDVHARCDGTGGTASSRGLQHKIASFQAGADRSAVSGKPRVGANGYAALDTYCVQRAHTPSDELGGIQKLGQDCCILVDGGSHVGTHSVRLVKEGVAGRGIPDPKDYGDLTQLTPGQLVSFIIQQHNAQRAGFHRDVRYGTPETGLFSWATRKELPKPGERRALYQTPVHEHHYGDFQGQLYGYGAGTVRRERKGQILLTKVTPDKISFTTADERYPQRFSMIRIRGGKKRDWLLVNNTPKDVIPYNKVHYTRVPGEQVEQLLADMKPGTSVQAKIDGAASLVKLLEHGVEVTSYRQSKTGLPIVHTERVFRGRPTDLKIPKKLVGTVLKGELYGVRRPKTVAEGTEPQEEVIPPQELGGLLNATLANSLQAQQEKGISLKNMVYDLQSLGSKSVDMDAVPYAQRLALVKEVIQHLPADVFHAPAEANSPEEATQLWRSIGEGKHPLTREGIVIHPPTGVPSKAKFLEDQDVHIRGMFPGEGKYYKRGVGGFTYSLTPDGPVLGRVGTGFDDDLRMDMYRNPDAYTGRVARVQHQGAFPGSGALRAPSFIALHEG